MIDRRLIWGGTRSIEKLARKIWRRIFPAGRIRGRARARSLDLDKIGDPLPFGKMILRAACSSLLLLSVICALYVRQNWHAHKLFSIEEYRYSFSTTILKGTTTEKTFALPLVSVQLADGRDVNLSLIYPYFLGSRMLGSTAVSWLSGPGSFIPLEDYLSLSFVATGGWGLGCTVLWAPCLLWDDPSVSSAAKDCVVPFSLWFGFRGRSDEGTGLNRRRLVPNELRAGMIIFSLAPANASILFILIQGGTTGMLAMQRYKPWLAAFGLFTVAGCVHVLKRWKRRTPSSWHDL
ncbi:uncharacterized protein LOC144710075 [Wolffia australiana]